MTESLRLALFNVKYFCINIFVKCLIYKNNSLFFLIKYDRELKCLGLYMIHKSVYDCVINDNIVFIQPKLLNIIKLK